MEAPPVERRLAAILAADVEGYSRLMHGDEEATMATLFARRALVDELIGRHRGRIANTAGDGVLAEFASILDAVHCAVEIQEALEQANDVEPEETDALPHRHQCRRRDGEIGFELGGTAVFDAVPKRQLEGNLLVGGQLGNRRRSRRHFWCLISLPRGRDILPRYLTEPEPKRADRVRDILHRLLAEIFEQYPKGTFASLARTRLDAVALSPPGPAAPTPRKRR
jgi:hypothetical protein